MKKKILEYSITSVVGLLIALVIVLSKQIWNANTEEVFHILTDAFFVSGVLLTCFGLLIVSYNGGTFDMLSFGLIKFFNMFRKDMSKNRALTFYDYRVAKHGKKKNFWYF